MSVQGNPPNMPNYTTPDGQPCHPNPQPIVTPKPPQKPKPAGSSSSSVYANNNNTNNSNNNNNNNVANASGNGQANAGNVSVNGPGTASGHQNNNGGNNVNNNGIMVGNNVGDQVNINTPAKKDDNQPEKPKVSGNDDAAGKLLAQRLHAQTHRRTPADKTEVASVYRDVNSNNAYTFFKEYNKLAANDQEGWLNHTEAAMDDSYRIIDPDNRINVGVTSAAIDALLTQAKGLGLENTSEFGTLKSLNDATKTKEKSNLSKVLNPIDTIKGRTAGDLTPAEAKAIDDAIKALIAKMDTIYNQ